MARQIVVDIIGDSSKFDAATNAAVKSGGRFSKQAVKGFGLGVGLGVFSLATSAIGDFVGALGDMQQAYKDDQVSQAKLKQALKNTIPAWDGSTAAIEAYATAQGRLGFQDDEIRDSIGQLIGITHDQTEAMRLNTLAQDLARAKGLDLATAIDIVTKAAQGNGKALKGLGIDVSGVTTAAGFLDAAQRNVTGSAEAWAATSEGKAAVANVKNAESMERIGKIVDQVATAVLPIAADAFSAVADVISDVADAVGPVVGHIVRELTPAFQKVVAFIRDPVIPIVSRLADVYFKTLGTVIGRVADVARTAFGIVSTIISGVYTTVSTTVGNITAAFNNVINFISRLPGRIASAARGMWDGIWNAFRGAINAIIRGWNSLKFTLPKVDTPFGSVGGFTIGTPNIPYLHKGGIVPGAPGSDVPAILQAGEMVTPRGQVGRAVVVNIYGPVYGDSLDELSRKIAERLSFAG